MSCFGGDDLTDKEKEEYDLCPCGEVHVDDDGNSVEGCSYSPISCDVCKHRYCDQSC